MSESKRNRAWIAPILAAAVLVFVDFLKPIHIDDATYHEIARHISQEPLNPYRFSMMSYDRPVAANRVLAPPVLLYSWAGVMRLAGDDVVLWKASMTPFALAFTFGAFLLIHRFARPWAGWFTLLLALSPAFLPSLNMMLDIPALGLSLLGLALFFSACDRRSGLLSSIAGLVAGLAIQTKYTALPAPLVILLYSQMFDRRWLGVLAVAVAGLAAGSWEVFLVFRQGESHFLYHALTDPVSRAPVATMADALSTILGQTCWPLALLALVALRWPSWLAGLASIGACFGLGLILDADPHQSEVASRWLGIATSVAVGVVAMRGLTRGSAAEDRRVDRFLVAWFLLELAGYFLLSPFPAVRRTMGLIVISGILVARSLQRIDGSAFSRTAVRGVVLASSGWGIFFAVVDHMEAVAQKNAAERVAAWFKDRNHKASIWYTGYWGFRFYAERLGMKQIVPADRDAFDPLERPKSWEKENGIEMKPPTPFAAGDWLAIPSGMQAAKFMTPTGATTLAATIPVENGTRWSTLGMYGEPLPLRLARPSEIRLVRVDQPFTPVVSDPTRRR